MLSVVDEVDALHLLFFDDDDEDNYGRYSLVFTSVCFSRMRSEGFLFSFLGVWGWWTVCGSFSCRGALIASLHCLWGR